MQIHEITIKKNTQLDEGVFDTIGGAAGKAVSGVKNVGSWIASPFKDVAQGYSTARQDQKGSAVADKAFRAWQKYVSQLEQSIAVQPAPAPTTPPPTTSSTGGKTQVTPTGLTHTANANNPNNDDDPPPPPPGGAAPAAGSTPATTPAKPNYGAQTGGAAKVTYNQPTGIPKTNTTQPTNTIGPKTPGVTTSTPATVAGTAQGQPITVGGQKIKPGQPGYDQLAKATLKELQAPATAVSPALAAFRDRSDGKYEQYLTAFVQKNLLAGMGFKGLVNQGEITNAIKAIAAPENADAAKQRPLWNDLVRACALAMPSQGALTGRTPGAAKDPDATKDPGDPNATKDPNASDEEPPADQAAQAEPTKPTMTRAQISQWISRNSEDHAALKAALDAINAVKG
jgi:hypothetical protein